VTSELVRPHAAAPTTDVDLRGLTEPEAAARRASGQGNDAVIQTGRTYDQILRQNLFTFINVVLFAIGFVMILLGLWGDALVSVSVVLLNVVISVTQEFRAKRKLDQIALLTRPKATVIRDGQEQVIDPSWIVLGDLIVIRAGDQLAVDGVIVGDGRVEVDESLLTGESDLIPKQAGDEVFSGSFCVNGSAIYEATKVGVESFANKLTASARQFRIVRTPLQHDINAAVRVLLLTAAICGGLFGLSFIINEASAVQVVQTAAVIAGLVPAGLVLMTATAYAMGAVRMSGRGALIQQSNAVESMSNVNVLCLDKTGTLTANRLHLNALYPIEVDEGELSAILGDYAHSTRAGNRTTEAIQALKGQSRRIMDEIPFSSDRKYSALAFDDEARRGVVVFGAPEMMRRLLADEAAVPQNQIEAWADQGLRVLMLAYSPEPDFLHDSLGQIRLPGDLRPIGLVSLGDELRPEAETTIAGFLQAGIRLKIISGDNPYTVAALARQAGITDDIKVISGPELETLTEPQITQTVEEVTIFGRITPQQKEMLVDALRRRGHYVAMIGDGVNDVLSLKKAQIGIAMQSGSAATRGVADIVLLNDSFAALPAAFMEGQRILNGMEDIVRLFLTRAIYGAFIIIGAAVVTGSDLFPFLPKHAALITLLTVGFPTFMLAAWARTGVPNQYLVRTAMRFIFPAALTLATAGLGVYVGYLLAHYIPLGAEPPEARIQAINTARTAMTTVLVLGGLLLVIFAEPPVKALALGDQLAGDWRPTWFALAMALVFAAVVLIEPLRRFFELEVLGAADYALLLVITAVWASILALTWKNRVFERFFG
jgi:cation-transporting ATPase E